MRYQSPKLLVLSKLLLAAVAIISLLALPARELAPGVPLGDLLLYCTLGAASALVLLAVAAVLLLQFSQFILRSGGTDPQWFWFSGEPRGLAALRSGRAVNREPQDRP